MRFIIPADEGTTMLVIAANSVTKAEALFASKPTIRAACIKAKCTDAHADAFIADLKANHGTITAALNVISTAIIKKLKGKDVLMTHFHNSPVAKTLFTATVLGPQFIVLNAGFDMSVHLKNGNLQLWLSYAKGGKKIMSDVPAPATGG